MHSICRVRNDERKALRAIVLDYHASHGGE
jgi:hypothetical protein